MVFATVHATSSVKSRRLPVASGAVHGYGGKAERRRRLRDAALIGSCLLLIPYWPPPNLFVTSFEQFIVPFSHTL